MIGRTMWCHLGVFAMLMSVGGCGLLDVADPLAIEGEDVENAEGAELSRRRAVQVFGESFSRLANFGAELTDEYFTDVTQRQIDDGSWEWRVEVDRRRVGYEYSPSWYGNWTELRRNATRAIDWLHAYVAPEAAKNRVGQMYALIGYSIMTLAENFCPGLPLNSVRDNRIIYGPPLSTNELFERALVYLDSALVYGADTSQVLHLAQVAQARSLLGLGRFTEAAEVAALVPDDFVALDGDEGDYISQLTLTRSASDRQSVADGDGGNGLNFVSANDPRLVLIPKGMATDGVTGLYGPAKYETGDEPAVIASGIEARLIQAEAALHADDVSWLTILNDLRATQIDPPMTALLDPGTPEARLDLLFRERAFWLFATGHRLGDLRRLIRIYGRDAESVFPTGPYRIGGVYETLTSIPFPLASESAGNPAVTGCTGP